ncbi:MAG: hypothetical protein U0528_04990 [Anaerolineae bacterium]
MNALEEALAGVQNRPVCIITETDRQQRMAGYRSWWDVAISEVSGIPKVQQAREDYEEKKQKERHFCSPLKAIFLNGENGRKMGFGGRSGNPVGDRTNGQGLGGDGRAQDPHPLPSSRKRER